MQNDQSFSQRLSALEQSIKQINQALHGDPGGLQTQTGNITGTPRGRRPGTSQAGSPQTQTGNQTSAGSSLASKLASGNAKSSAGRPSGKSQAAKST